MANLNSYELVKENGKRNTVLCNAFRGQGYDKVMSILTDAGFEPVAAANGDIAIPMCIDSTTGATYYLRLSVSFTAKDLESKIEKKPRESKKEAPVIPSLFD